MEVLLIILLMVFLGVTGKKKKGRDAAGKPGGTAQAAQAARVNAAKLRAAARAQMSPRAQSTPPRAQSAPPRAQSAPPGNVTPVKVAGQSSPVFMAAPTPMGASILDDEGCVGGSMAHTHDEGESREEHARHTEAAKRREAAELLARAQAESAASERLARMRQAVVMAEILGKPKALQKRT